MRILGHLIRDRKLDNDYIIGKIEGIGGRGRPRLKYLFTCAKTVGGGLSAMLSYKWRTQEHSGGEGSTTSPSLRHFGKVR